MTQTFEQWAESEGLDMSVDWKGEFTSPLTAGALRGWEAAQSAGQVPVAWRYQTPTGWHVTTDPEKIMRLREYHPVEALYAAPVNGEERADGAKGA